MRKRSAGFVLVVAGLALWGCPGFDSPPVLVVTPQALDFGPGVSEQTFTVAKNATPRSMAPFTITPAAAWISVNPDAGDSTGPSDAVTVTVQIDRSQLPAGSGSATIAVAASGVAPQTLTLNVEPYYGPDFVADAVTPYAGQDVTFTDRSSPSPAAGPVTAWLWTFGDGASSAEQNPHHTYAQPGSYTVALEITTGAGKQTATKPDFIEARQSTTPQHAIVIDGVFDDWASVPSYTDPENNTHDTDPRGVADVPVLVTHPDVDLVEYKFTHDSSNLYAYFRSKGIIGNTLVTDRAHGGRYYAIVTIDVDNKTQTGYWLNEGGYYPTSRGYDMNMEVEWFNGAVNVGDYINHGAMNAQELDQAFADQLLGIVNILPGTYDYYTEWVMFDDGSIVFVKDKGPVYHGIIEVAVSPDGHQAEMKAPFRGFMKDPDGKPIMALGKVINVSFSLEASGELAPAREWASNTAAPIKGYFLTP